MVACDDGERIAGIPEFPREKTAVDFPGMRYSEFEAEIPRPSAPVWLIGIDGATWDLIRPAVDRNELPVFAELLRNGAHAVLTSEEPTISPALWATVATGVPRFEHGVVNFMVRRPGSFETVEVGPPDRRSPAIWELVGAAGGTSTVIGWFGSYPAEAINGYYVSKGFDPENLHERQVYPPTLLDELRRCTIRVRPIDVESIAKTPYLKRTLLNDARTMAALRMAVARQPTDLTVVYLSGIDVVQHVAWKHMDPASQEFPQDGPPEPALADVIPAYYRFVDNALGEMLEIAPPGTTFMIVSDHGAGPLRVHEAFHLQLEVLLATMGLDRVHAISELYRHDKRIWADSREAVKAARDRLAALRTDQGAKVFESIVDHTSDAGWHTEQPALTVRFSRHALVADYVDDNGRALDFSPIRHRYPDVSGSHRLDGILLLYGPNVRPGALPRANLYRVAPTILYLLGLPQDGRMLRFAPNPGGVLEAAIRGERLDRSPVRMVPSYPGTDRTALLRHHTSSETDPAAAESIERLRSLGYVR